MCVRMRTVPGSTSPCAAIAMSLKATAMATTAPSLSDTNPVTAGRAPMPPGRPTMPNWGALSSAPGITMDRNSVAAPSRSSRVTVTSQRPAARSAGDSRRP